MKRLFSIAFTCLLMLSVIGAAQATEENISAITTAEELLAALNDDGVTGVVVGGDADIEAVLDGATLTVGKPLDVQGSLIFVEGTVDLQAQATVSGNLSFGGGTFNNHGYVRIRSGGLLGSYQSDFVNFGAAYIEKNGLLECDRGGGWTNSGVLVNEGTIRVTADGGNASLRPDSVIDNLGTLDVTSSYFHDYNATILGDAQAVAQVVTPGE